MVNVVNSSNEFLRVSYIDFEIAEKSVLFPALGLSFDECSDVVGVEEERQAVSPFSGYFCV